MSDKRRSIGSLALLLKIIWYKMHPCELSNKKYVFLRFLLYLVLRTLLKDICYFHKSKVKVIFIVSRIH